MTEGKCLSWDSSCAYYFLLRNNHVLLGIIDRHRHFISKVGLHGGEHLRIGESRRVEHDKDLLALPRHRVAQRLDIGIMIFRP